MTTKSDWKNQKDDKWNLILIDKWFISYMFYKHITKS